MEQLLLDRHLHGGYRPGSGRKKAQGRGPSHDTRERITRHIPLHITLHVREGLPSLRKPQFLECLYDSLAAARHYGAVDPDRFRICHFSLQNNHLHTLGEAESEADLAAGMHALNIRLSKNFNKLLGTSGSLFPERYHVELLRTPTQTYNGLVYTLCNGRHHGSWPGIHEPDLYSSAAYFTGWQNNPARPTPRLLTPLSPPRSWLLSTGWRKADFDLPHWLDIPFGRGAQS